MCIWRLRITDDRIAIGDSHFEVTSHRINPLDAAKAAMLYLPDKLFEEVVMWKRVRPVGITTALAACLLCATLGFAEDTTTARVRGTLEQVNENALTVKTRNGTTTTIQLKDAAHIVAVTKGAMSDIKENSFVGIAAMPQPDGTSKAIEVSVFAEPLRGTAEGHYPWDLMPNSTMTNAAVTHQVEKQEGNTLTLKYKDGEKTIVVPADATIVNLIPGDKSDLKPGAKVFIPVKNTDGNWVAAVALVGRDGVTPPM